MTDTLELARNLIRKPSVTPEDAGCQELIATYLQDCGFSCEHLQFNQVSNLWARRGISEPLFVFAGHTDVVPTGPVENWRHAPFDAIVAKDLLFGRGAADMKSGVAAMVIATQRFITNHPDHCGSIGFLITSDEEGPAVDGTVKVVEHLQNQNVAINWCLVGEPSSSERVGDVIKNGRRGSISATLTVHGKQGHVAYPHLADNPIHRLSAILDRLAHIVWDQGNEHFPATTFQVSNITAGTGVDNVIPGSAVATFNLRYSTELTAEDIKERIEKITQELAPQHHLEWRHSGNPFLTPAGKLVDACTQAVQEVAGYSPQLSTAGGTSDGRFIAPTGAEVVELGVVNESIHKIDEHTNIQQLEQLTDIYYQILENLLTN